MRNVLVFMTDQQSGGTVLEGHRLKARTSRLDQFRERAVTFARSYATAPHCCPSRASFFTGLYPSQHGVWNNVNVTNALSRGPREGTPYWSQSFIQAGYTLAFSGKWHVSNVESPAAHGWRELFLHPPMPPVPHDLDEQWRHARDHQLSSLRAQAPRDPEVVRGEGEIIRPGWPRYVHYGVDEDPFEDAAVVRHAAAFVRTGAKESRRPWLLYVGTLGPHDPYTPPQRFLDWYDPDDIELPDSFDDLMADKPHLYRRTRDRFDQLTEREHREALRHYLAFCSYEDHLFGELLDAVEEAGSLSETIILYLSDHGDYAGDHGLWTKGLPSFSSAYHIPTVVSAPDMPGAVRGSTDDLPISLVDFGPTLLELCDLPPVQHMAGESFAPSVKGQRSGSKRGELMFQSNGNEVYGIQRIVLTDHWKLVCNLFDDDELYDLVNDPAEVSNLLARDEDARCLGRGATDIVPPTLRPVVFDLYQRLWRFSVAHDDEILNGYIATALATYGPLVTEESWPSGSPGSK